MSGEGFNAGNSWGYSILEVIDAAERVTGHKIPSKLSPRRPGDPAVLVASKEKLSACWVRNQPIFRSKKSFNPYGRETRNIRAATRTTRGRQLNPSSESG